MRSVKNKYNHFIRAFVLRGIVLLINHNTAMATEKYKLVAMLKSKIHLLSKTVMVLALCLAAKVAKATEIVEYYSFLHLECNELSANPQLDNLKYSVKFYASGIAYLDSTPDEHYTPRLPSFTVISYNSKPVEEIQTINKKGGKIMPYRDKGEFDPPKDALYWLDNTLRSHEKETHIYVTENYKLICIKAKNVREHFKRPDLAEEGK